MVASAQRHGELVADLAAERAVLREAKMMGIRGLTAADQAGCVATNLTWSLSRMRRGSGNASTLLSMASALTPILGRLAASNSAEDRTAIRLGLRRGKSSAAGTPDPSSVAKLRPERLLDALGVGCGQAVLGGQDPWAQLAAASAESKCVHSASS